MYVRVQIEQGIDRDALAVPQQAVQRNDAGAERSLRRHATTTARSLQPVRARPRRSTSTGWSRTASRPGDRVVVDGFQKFVPGAIVRPVPWQRERSAGIRRAGADHALGAIAAVRDR